MKNKDVIWVSKENIRIMTRIHIEYAWTIAVLQKGSGPKRRRKIRSDLTEYEQFCLTIYRG